MDSLGNSAAVHAAILVNLIMQVSAISSSIYYMLFSLSVFTSCCCPLLTLFSHRSVLYVLGVFPLGMLDILIIRD